MPPSPLITREDSLSFYPTTTVPTSPIAIPTSSPDASPIYSKKSSPFVGKNTSAQRDVEETTSRQESSIPLTFEAPAPLLSSPFLTKHEPSLEVKNVSGSFSIKKYRNLIFLFSGTGRFSCCR